MGSSSLSVEYISNTFRFDDNSTAEVEIIPELKLDDNVEIIKYYKKIIFMLFLELHVCCIFSILTLFKTLNWSKTSFIIIADS